MMKIRKAVFPAAGLGTRFLPATKAMPKEMLPLVDRPSIQYVVEEARDSGIHEIILITGRGKRAIEDHFDISLELEYFLKEKGELQLLEEVRQISEMVSFCYIRQKEPRGLGHAVLCAREAVGQEPFAVLLGDDLIRSEIPCLKQLLEVYEKYHCPVVAVEEVDWKAVSSYGVIQPRKIEDRIYEVLDLVEKPPMEEAPSNLIIIGRYILVPEIFEILEGTPPDRKGEIQLTDGLKRLLASQRILACQFTGKRFDAGNKLGFLRATIEYALSRPDLREDLIAFLRQLPLD
ncbi:MAG: UTP--glucose-1-phosphate uridylyltransferase GalU [Candidatus Tectomicrobia bacterium]|uniref:UTP--glucose-1-phosphate uridylyltransferase n=1 Tax=Tectimicrobiota bacterium TaxID=2528274 RepID=A0A932CL22_UNCTE|nr:UTP--glucose-1-phosphate uridylyltransferase GalU [Candidatus Tectomicrobia bacterium]